MSYLQRMEKRHPGLRSFLTVLLSAAMVLNSVPTQALAEVVNEPQALEIESVEDETDATLDETKATEGEQPADEQPEPTEAEPAEAEPAKAEEATPAEPSVQTFVYEDESVKVTAEPTDPSAIPADAELVVRPVTPTSEDYYYDAFIDALNDNSEGDKVYSDKNTLLYDVMFLVWNEYGEQVEVEPADGSVKVNFEFKKSQLADDLGAKAVADVDVTHLPIGDEGVQVEAVDSVAKGDEQIEMSVDSFSVYAFSYTVDFTYDGYTYSIEGESNIMLSKLFDILGIDEKIDNVEDATFSNPELVTVEQVEGDWQLTSLAPFTSNETLTVALASGAKYVIDVTDAQTYTVNVGFQGYEGESIAYDGTDNFYVYVELCKKNADGTAGDIVGWNSVQLDTNNPSVTFDGFQDYTKNENQVETWNPLLEYNDSDYVVSTRLYKSSPAPTYHNVRNPGEHDSLPVDIFDGYNVLSNIADNDNHNTDIVLQKSYTKEFAVNLNFEPEYSTPIVDDDNYYLFVIVHHKTTGDTYNLQKITTNGANPQSIVISKWYNGDGNLQQNEKFTGNEQGVEVKVLKAEEALNYSMARNLEKCVEVADGGLIKSYILAKDSQWPETGIGDYTHDESRHVDSYAYNLTLSTKNATNDYNFKSILGPSTNYGITAEFWSKENHSQTNCQVNHFTGSGDTRPDLSGGNAGVLVIGEFNEKDDNAKNHVGKVSMTGTVEIGSPIPSNLIALVDKNSGNPSGKVIGDGLSKTIVVESDGSELQRDFVEPSIAYMQGVSNELKAHESTFEVSYKPGASKLYIDTTGLPSDATIYIDADDITDFLTNGKMTISKLDDQVIVFNFKKTESVTIGQFYVNGSKTDSPVPPGAPENVIMDQIARHVVWNFASCSYVELDTTAGIFLEPNDDSESKVTGTSAGWIVSDGFVHNPGGEWHFVYGDLPTADKIDLMLHKTVEGKTPTSDEQFTFTLERFAFNDVTGAYEWKELDSATNSKGIISFDGVGEYEEGWTVYRITESSELPDGTPADITTSEDTFYALVQCKYINKGQADEQLIIGAPRYYKQFSSSDYDPDVSNPIKSGTNAKGFVSEAATKPTFDNKKTEPQDSVTFKPSVTKAIEGSNAPAETFTFEIAKAAGNAKSSDVMPKNVTAKTTGAGKANFEAITYTEAGDYYYTITEQNPATPTPGMKYDLTTHYVKVSVVDNDGKLSASATYGNTKADCDKAEASTSLTITNTYTEAQEEKGSVKIVKTFSGLPEGTDVSKLAFEITAPDGTKQTVTYDKFNENGEYVIGTDLNIGDKYSVKETNAETLVSGYELVSTSLTEGADKATKDGATITLTNVYKKNEQPGPETGKLTVTKVVEGVDKGTPVNNEFKVIIKNNATGEYVNSEGKLQKDEYKHTIKANGKLEFNELPAGAYTVSEADENRSIDGYVSQPFKAEGAGNVAKDAPTTVTITNSYKKTSVSISKTDITGSKELEGAHIQVLDSNKKVVDEWTSTNDVHTIVGKLNTGETYTLKETVAPNGYKITTDTTFILKADGTIDAENTTATIKNGVILIKDDLTKVTVSKKAVGGEDELAGATIQILDAKGNKVEEWTSGDKAKEITGLKTGVEYTLHEEVAPDGYTVASDIKFTIGEDGTVKVGTKEIEGGLLLINDSLTKVTVSKKAVGGEDELAGATIQILDAKGNKVEEWTSGDKAKEITGLKTGVEYTLHEEVAPDGYTVASDIAFSIDEDGNVKSGDKIVTGGVLLINDTKTSVSISKVDVVGGKEVAGATIQIIEMVKNEDGEQEENIVKSWTSGTKAETIEGLKTETEYILRETVAPEGYATTTDTTFTIDKTGKVTSTGTVSKDGVLLVEDAKTKVSISKVDLGNGKEVEGAKIEVKDSKGTVVESWTSTDKPHVIEGKLKTGEIYTLSETVAPDGYAVTTDTTFVLKDDGTIDTEKTTTKVKDGVLLVEDAKTSVSISKVDIADGEEVEGATIEVKDSRGTVIDSWTSTDKPHVIEGKLKTGEEYTLSETVAPDGYGITTDTTFVLKADGTIDKSKTTTTVSEDGVLLVEDAKTKITISKVDIADSEELAGAHMQVLDSKGKVLHEWTSEKEEVYVIEGLKTGETYTLREVTAPDGYTLTTDIEFSFDKNGELVIDKDAITTDEDGNIITLVQDAKTLVKVSKVDIADGKEVADAHIQIIQMIEKNGVLVEDVVTEWDSKLDNEETENVNEAIHEVEGLITGKEYILRETVAPDGYLTTTDITFSVDENGKVTTKANTTTDADGNTVILVEDAKTKVSISKVDVDGGEELVGATIQILDSTGNEVASWTSTDEPYAIEGLKVGEKYTLHEEAAPDGYAFASDITFTIGKDGKVNADAKTAKDADGNDVILIEDALTEISVSKTDIAGKELEGATIQIIDSEGTIVAEWISTKEPEVIGGLNAGETYTLHEEVAPDGYTIASDTTFTIENDGSVKVGDTVVEDNLLLIEDALTSVSISKVDIAGGEELEGAHIVLKDSEGKVVEEWDSTKEAQTITGLKTGEEYTLSETVAPEGYEITTDTHFVLKDDGSIDTEKTTTTVSDDGVLLVEDEALSVNISKTDIANSAEVAGATLVVTDSKGNQIDSWTSDVDDEETEDINEAVHKVTGLKAGEEYTLSETVAPDGYAYTTDIIFKVDDHGNVTTKAKTTTDANGNTVILVEDAKTVVRISKTDVADGKELEGATMQIVDSEGKVVKEWISTNKVEVIEGVLNAGQTYTLKETIAPDGYLLVETDTTFTITKDGKLADITSVSKDANGNDVILVEDEMTKIRVSKVDIADDKEVAGAHIQILGPDGKVVKIGNEVLEWISSDKGAREITGLKTGVTYTLHEEVAPEGYVVASDTTFFISPSGQITTADGGDISDDGVLLVKDAKTSVSISKTDLGTGEEVEGATIQVLDKDGKVVEEWTSTKEAHKIEGLKTGEEYTLRETVAPEGYTVTNDTTFTIDREGKVTTTGSSTTDKDGNTVLLVEDAKTVVRVSKTDIADGEELEGATIQILDKDGKVVDEWISSKESPVHVTEGLKTGEEYTLRETVAPYGYGIATDTTFSIDEKGNVTTTGTMTEDGIILIEDSLLTGKATISLEKELRENIPWAAKEAFTFKLADESGKELGTATAKVGETATFKSLDVAGAGDTYYQITEVPGSTKHVTYDSNVYWAKVTATPNKTGDGLDITVKYGKDMNSCTQDKLVITNIYAAPALEKYINKDVHQDLPAFDTPFTYDILAFVTNDAKSVVITDPMIKGIRFVDGAKTKVTVQDIGADNDHTAHGTVEQAKGTDVNFTATVDDVKNVLTVNIPDATSHRGHWVRVTYDVVLNNHVVSDEAQYVDNDVKIGENGTVISPTFPKHDGVETYASYVVTADNGNYELTANHITVTPPVETFKVTKKWVDANGNEVAWPKGATVTIELLGNGEPMDQISAEVAGQENAVKKMTITLDAKNPTGTFAELPIYESVTYSVVETKVTGVDAGFSTVYSGTEEEGFVVTNTFKEEKKQESSTKKLPQTSDPTMALYTAAIGLAGVGSALVAGGVAARKRREER